MKLEKGGDYILTRRELMIMIHHMELLEEIIERLVKQNKYLLAANQPTPADLGFKE